MKITIKQLKELGACKESIQALRKQKNRDAKHILRKLVKAKKYDWANWYVTRIFTKSQAVLYAIKCAEACLPRFEEQLPHDKRPRQAIKAAKNWLKNPTKKNMYAAESAARYADSAVESAARYAARSAKSAAESAAWCAAESAAWCAWSAWYAWSARSAESASHAAWSRQIEIAIQILGL